MNSDDNIISDHVLKDIAFRAKLTISEEQTEDFKNSLSKIVKMFHDMSLVNVCEFKEYGNKIRPYEELRADIAENNTPKEELEKSCKYYNSETQHFEVPKVIKEDK